jgi:hypothetical protein
MITGAIAAAGLAASGLLGRAAHIARGPFGGAIGVTLAAVVVVGGIAAGLGWLRGDARRDAAAVCDAREVAAQLAAERSLRLATEAAARRGAADLVEMRRVLSEAAERTARLETEMEAARAEALERDRAQGRSGPVLRVDDPWLRQGTAPGAARPAAGR